MMTSDSPQFRLIALQPHLHYDSILSWLADRDTRMTWRTLGRTVQPSNLESICSQSSLSYVGVSGDQPLALYESLHFDKAARSIEISVLTAPHARHSLGVQMGIAKFTKEVFAVFPVERVLANVIHGGSYSSQSLQNYGFEAHGRLPEAIYVDGLWRDIELHSLERNNLEQMSLSLPSSTDNAALVTFLKDRIAQHDGYRELDSLAQIEVAMLCVDMGIDEPQTREWLIQHDTYVSLLDAVLGQK